MAEEKIVLYKSYNQICGKYYICIKNKFKKSFIGLKKYLTNLLSSAVFLYLMVEEFFLFYCPSQAKKNIFVLELYVFTPNH